MSVFVEDDEDSYETADFPLTELSLDRITLGALATAGYRSFLDIIDLDRGDFLAVEGITEEAVDQLLALIDDLTVVDSDAGRGGDAPLGVKGGLD